MDIPNNYLLILIALEIWTLPWKGMALWKAAKSNNSRWFIILLVVNTIGLLEIIYLFAVPPKVKFIFGKQKK